MPTTLKASSKTLPMHWIVLQLWRLKGAYVLQIFQMSSFVPVEKWLRKIIAWNNRAQQPLCVNYSINPSKGETFFGKTRFWLWNWQTKMKAIIIGVILFVTTKENDLDLSWGLWYDAQWNKNLQSKILSVVKLNVIQNKECCAKSLHSQ